MALWWDTHVHLDRYELAERAGLLARAQAAGVAVVAVSADLQSSRIVAALGDVRGKAVGIHPTRTTAEFPHDELRELARAPGVLAIGEVGFDDSGPDLDVQTAAFHAQCSLARELGHALVLHIDGAAAWATLRAHAEALTGLRVVRHYFTGGEEQAAWHRELGHFLSFGNPLRRSPALQAIAASYPPHLLLIETDTYPLPGRTTEPKDVVKVGQHLAELRGWKFEQTQERLEENTVRAFSRYFS